MGLLDKAVSIANKVTLGLKLQALVTYEKFMSANGSGARLYASAVQKRAIVEHKQQQVRKVDGQLAMARATVTFLDPAVVINAFDKITLPDGSTGPILAWEGFVDPVTSKPILSQVFLG